MAIKKLAPVFLAGAAAAIILAPAAGAASGASCDDSGPASVCTRNGHAAIVATPNPLGAQQLLIAPGPFGSMPPLLALD